MYVSTNNKGRTVLAAKEYEAGEMIVQDHCIRVPKQRKGTTLYDYVFRDSTGDYIALGLSSLVNHSSDSNAMFIVLTWTEREETYKVVQIIATRKIRFDEEVTTDYGPGINFQPIE